MIVGQAGIFASSSGFPPNGTLLSSECVDLSPYMDSLGYEWTGSGLFYTLRQTFANGSGGTYTEDTLGGGTCYLPYGWGLSQDFEGGDINLEWNDGTNSGTFLAGSVTASYTYADGSGGTYTEGGIYTWGYDDYYVINDTFTGSGGIRTILRTVPPGSIEYEPYTCEAYGTKSGSPYWDYNSSSLYQNYHDGSCGTYSDAWDGNPPNPPPGTYVGSNYACDLATNDQLELFWSNICYTSNSYVTDWPETETSIDIDESTLPEGFAVTGIQVQPDFFETSYYVTNASAIDVYPWQYGPKVADGIGGFYIEPSFSSPHYLSYVAPLGTVLSDTIPMYDVENNSYYNARIEADGSGGFVLITLS